MNKHKTLAIALTVTTAFQVGAHAEQALSHKQIGDEDAVERLTEKELAELGDPFFNLVLKNHADAVTLSEILKLVQPNERNQRAFVVDERIMDSKKEVDEFSASRRSVISFAGSNRGELLSGNVMLSVFFDPDGYFETGDVEALGWDDRLGRYNYYKLDGEDNERNWKFRGSSDGADLLEHENRVGCMECHINGGPIMKELLFPWNNWHSFAAEATYLKGTASEDERWEAATSGPLQQLTSAEQLEQTMMSALTQFNERRIEDRLGPKREDGLEKVNEARRLLKSLFVTTEFNIISATGLSGLHPVGKSAAGATVRIPPSFFLNADLIGGGGIASLTGLGLEGARRFSDIAQARLSHDEYKETVSAWKMKIFGTRGDTNFAWFVPEPSFIDNSMVDELVERGIVPGQFVAAVMAIDLEQPVLSDQRASLFKYVPDSFSFKAIDSEQRLDFTLFREHELSKSVIAAIEADEDADETAKEFLDLLKAQEPEAAPLVKLEESIADYSTQLKQDLGSADKEAKAEAIDELMQKALCLRQKVAKDEVLGALIESEDLFATTSAFEVDC